MLGDSKKGVEILADLYLNTNDPNYIYNQGRCFEQNGENEKAILRFQEYQRKVPAQAAATKPPGPATMAHATCPTGKPAQISAC